MSSSADNAPPHQRPQQPLTLHLHSELSSAHSTHGVSHDDYSQYASYCTRKLSRLRHDESVKRDLLHSRVYKSSLSTKAADDGGANKGGGKAKKHAYRAIDMTNLPSEVLASHENYFWEPLYCAERCWASSMAIKAEGNNDNTTGVNSGGGGGGILGVNDPKKHWSPGKVRAHTIKRLRKAAKFATLLETLTTSTKRAPVDEPAVGFEENGEAKKEEDAPHHPVDKHTQMEAKAYASWMRGNLALEQGHWQTACNEYQTALTLCESLASDGGGSDDAKNDMRQLELHDFFTARAKNVIAPLLRYCHYELQEKGMSPTEKISFLRSTSSSVGADATPLNDPLQSKLHSLKAQTLQSQATSGDSMAQIVFRENGIAVETKELRMALLKIQDLRSDWEDGNNNKENNSAAGGGGGGSDAKFMALLSGYDDAISLTNQELKQLSALKSGPAVNAKRFQLVNIMGYCKYQKLKLVMGRNEELADGIIQHNKQKGMTLKHFEEVAHLYDALLQDARAVASLPGGGSPDDFDGNINDDAAVVEDEFLLEANANILRLRSLRCYYLARMHASPLVRKYPEALALLDQAESLAQEASEEIGACDKMEGGDEMLEKLESLLEEMRGEKCRLLAVSYLGENTVSTSGKPLLERLHDYDIPSASTPLAHVPPRLEPMACKPSFFDVALNYVSDYPVEELEQACEEFGDGKSTESTKGFLGWFRR